MWNFSALSTSSNYARTAKNVLWREIFSEVQNQVGPHVIDFVRKNLAEMDVKAVSFQFKLAHLRYGLEWWPQRAQRVSAYSADGSIDCYVSQHYRKTW